MGSRFLRVLLGMSSGFFLFTATRRSLARRASAVSRIQCHSHIFVQYWRKIVDLQPSTEVILGYFVAIGRAMRLPVLARGPIFGLNLRSQRACSVSGST